MATPPVKPTTTPPPPAKPPNHVPPPAQGSVDPKEHPPASPPHSPSLSGEVIIQNAPPLPAEQLSGGAQQKSVMESGEAEQEAGKQAMDLWKKRQEAEEEAGKAAVKRQSK